MEEKKKWEFKRAVRNIFKFEKGDLYYVLLTIIILAGALLYMQETKVAHAVYSNLSHTCEIYNSLKAKALNDNVSIEDINLNYIANLTIKQVADER